MTLNPSQLHFLRPGCLVLLPLLAGFWLWIRYRLRRKNESLPQISPHLLQHLVVHRNQATLLTPLALLLPLWALGAIAIAGPSWRRQPSPFAQDDTQLMVVLKVSESMLTADLPPSRLEQAQGKLVELLRLRGGAATGLVAYNGSAHLVMPATKDAGVIRQMLESLDPSVMPIEGDGLAQAIQLASDQLASVKRGGSILVVADGASESAVGLTSQLGQATMPLIQFLVPLRTDQALRESGIPQVASFLSAPVSMISSDDRDIQLVARRANTAVSSATKGDSSEWKDDGYLLIPLIAIVGLFWARQGWSVA